jgi:hypothetical protein
VPATVPCGGTLCQVGNGGTCCVSGPGASATYTCISSGSCPPPLNGVGGDVSCDSEVDCPSGQICCGTGNNAFQARCLAASNCKGSPQSFGVQICDPSLAPPSECLTGLCSVTLSNDPALRICQ